MPSQPRPTPTPAEIAKGLGWLARNLPTIAAWITYLKKAVRDAKATGNLVVVIACAMSSGACSTTQVAAGVAAVGGILAGLGKLPDLPPPPGTETATATPTPTPVSVTPTSTPPASGTANPSATPTPTPSIPPTPVPTATPTPTLMPTSAPPTPAPTPTPTTPPQTDACPCQVICTSEFLGWNKPGVPPDVVVGSDARIDVTCRQARHQGDTRGLPVDRGTWPLWCEPASDPVDFHVSVPDGVSQHRFNDGYGLRLSNLQAGQYRIHVTPRKGALDRKGAPIELCGWGHDDSVRDTLEFSL